METRLSDCRALVGVLLVGLLAPACGASDGDTDTDGSTDALGATGDRGALTSTETDTGPIGSVRADDATTGDSTEIDSNAATDAVDASATDVRLSPTVGVMVCSKDDDCLRVLPGTNFTVCDIRRPDGVAMCYEQCPIPGCFNRDRPYCDVETGKCSSDPSVESGANCGRESICGTGCERYQCVDAVGCPTYGDANNCASLSIEGATCKLCLTDCYVDADCLDVDESRCLQQTGRCVTVDEHQRHYKYGKYKQ
jgi:hypothetical protein